MIQVFYMPLWHGNYNLAISTAYSLKEHEPEIEIVFSYEGMDRQNELEQLGRVFYGGERGWAFGGKRYFRQMNDLVIDGYQAIIKLDPDAYCLRPGGVAAIKRALQYDPVVGSSMVKHTREGIQKLSLGGIVGMRADFIRELYYETFYICEDRTRSKLLERQGKEARSIPEIKCFYRNENYSIEGAAFVHPWIRRRNISFKTKDTILFK